MSVAPEIRGLLKKGVIHTSANKHDAEVRTLLLCLLLRL